MSDPKTKEEAAAKRYGAWAGRPKGYAFKSEQCAFEVMSEGWTFHQCSRKPGHGPDSLYCKQHAQKVR